MGVAESPTVTRRLGLLGGSFDPVHRVHLALARAALQQLELERVLWLPAGQPWQRQPLGATTAQRLAMLHLALQDEPAMDILTLEVERDGSTYTVETLAALGAGDDPAQEYVWLLGSDQLANFCTWHRWPEIVRRVRLAVALRPGHAAEPPPLLDERLNELGTPLLTLSFSPMELSATAIRQRVAAGQSIEGYTPAAVVRYIHDQRLYLQPPTA